MNIINWIKNLFNKQPVEPVSDAWIDMVKRLEESKKKLKAAKEEVLKAEQFKKTVRNTYTTVQSYDDTPCRSSYSSSSSDDSRSYSCDTNSYSNSSDSGSSSSGSDW